MSFSHGTMFVVNLVEIYSVVFSPALHTDRQTDRHRGSYFVKEPLFEVREHKTRYCHLNLNL